MTFSEITNFITTKFEDLVHFLVSSSSPSVDHYVLLGMMIFGIGLLGVMMHKQNIINILMSIELMLLGVNINFVAFSTFLNSIDGQIFTIFVLTVAAAEAAIGLSILVVYFRRRRDINIVNINEMRG